MTVRARLWSRRPFVGLFWGGLWSLSVVALWMAPRNLAAQTARIIDTGSVRTVLMPTRGEIRENRTLAVAGMQRGGGVNENPDDELAQRNGYLRGFTTANGEVVALDRFRLRVYADNGVLVATIGRFGSGPGEARLYTSGCATRGDTLVAFDNGTRRLTVATLKSGVVRQLDVSRTGYLIRYGCLSDGTVLFERRSSVTPDRMQLVRLDLAGIERGVVATYPARQATWRVRVAASGDVVAIADPMTQQITVVDAEGRVRVIVRLREPIGSLSTAELRQLDLPVLTGFEGAAPPERRRPQYGDVLLDRDGVLWVEDFSPTPETPGSWTGVSTKTGALYRFSVDVQALKQSWPPAQLLEIDSRGALFLYTEQEFGSKVFARFSLPPPP